MAEAVVSFVAEKLGDLILQEGKFLFSVGDQVRGAQNELRMINRFLKDADAKQRDEEVIRGFVAEIRDAAYDLEDVVETFAFKVASKRKGGFKNLVKRFGCIFNEGVNLHQIGSEIGSITTRIANLRSSLRDYNIQEISQSGGATSSQLHERKQQLRRTYSRVIDRDVVGLEKSTEQLVMHLVKDEYHHRVVSIWGMGGLGKSTLAKKVYHHDDVRRRFSCFAWVCVSQQFQVRTVWEEILVKLLYDDDKQRQEIARMSDDAIAKKRTEIAGMSDDAIAKKIYQIQQDKRCLVVIDDIWTTEAWDSLKAGFLYELENSKILLTTRIKVVAEHADSRGFLYQPLPLTEIESWELFKKIALLPREGEIDLEIYNKLEELAKKMLERCAGLPLAINVLAGLLAKKNTVHEWDAVHKNIDANIMRGVGQGKEYAGVSWLLELSFDDLPYHLKPCFLYLGLFPEEDSEISASGLTKQWMAEGFISSSTVNSMEDSAYDCLNHLVERCLVQVGKPGLQVRNIKTCRIHDLMRDMCLLKAEEENFLQIANFSNRNSSVGKVCRLAIHLKEDNEKLVPSRDERDCHMRTLLYFGPNNYWMPKQVKSLRSMLKDFQLLRILKFDRMWLGGEYLKLPDAVGSMVHLRFLSLRDSCIRQVPSSIGNLINLQTLDLHNDSLDDKLLPDVFWKMEQLRHLYFPSFFTSRRKLKLSTLHNLQTLSGISSNCCNFGDLAELKNLTKLVVEFRGPSSTDLGKLLQCTSSNRIRSLAVRDLTRDNTATVVQIILSCRDLCALYLDCVKIKELATGLQSYHNLTKLTVYFSDLKYDQMAMLEQVPNLRTLALFNAFKSDTETPNSETLLCSKGGFRRLQSLYLHDSNLKKWIVSEGAMPSLCRLTISYCYSLKEIPIGLRYVTALKELIIEGMPRRFCSRLEEGGDDFCTIQHVPSVVIRYVLEDEDETLKFHETTGDGSFLFNVIA